MNSNRFRGHDRGQWRNLKNLPNLIYADRAERALFHTLQRVAGGFGPVREEMCEFSVSGF